MVNPLWNNTGQNEHIEANKNKEMQKTWIQVTNNKLTHTHTHTQKDENILEGDASVMHLWCEVFIKGRTWRLNMWETPFKNPKTVLIKKK